MNVYDFNDEYQVYYSAFDRFIKKVNDHVYDAFHVTVIDEEKKLTINTIDFNELTLDQINKFLHVCGLKYIEKDHKIVQTRNENEIIEAEEDLLLYVLADRLNVSGYINEMRTSYDFTRARELNEILLEHDVPIKYSTSQLNEI